MVNAPVVPKLVLPSSGISLKRAKRGRKCDAFAANEGFDSKQRKTLHCCKELDWLVDVWQGSTVCRRVIRRNG